MREVRGAFVKLQPANNAVIGKIFCHTRFWYAEMLRKLRFERIRTAAAGTTSQKISDGDSESLAGLNVVIAGEIGIGENENAGTDRRMIRFAKFYRSAGQQAAKLHFEKRQSGGETGIPRTAPDARTARLSNRFDRQ
jgi:hypothetical protein